MANTAHVVNRKYQRRWRRLFTGFGLLLLVSPAAAQTIKFEQLFNYGSEGGANAFSVFEDSLVYSVSDALFRLDSPDADATQISLPPELGAGTRIGATFQVFDGALYMHAIRNTISEDTVPFSTRHQLHRFDSLNSEPVWIDIPNIDTGRNEGDDYSDDTNEFAVYQDKLYFFSRRPRELVGIGPNAGWSFGLFAIDANNAEPYQVLWQDYVDHPESDLVPANRPYDLKSSELGLTFWADAIPTDQANQFRWFYRIAEPQRMDGLPAELPYQDLSVIEQLQITLPDYEAWNGDLVFSDSVDPIGAELFRYDGDSGDITGYDLKQGGDSSPANFVVVDNVVYFTANIHSDGLQIESLYKFDSGQSEPQVVIEAFESAQRARPLAAWNSGLLYSGMGASSTDLLYLPADGGDSVALNVGSSIANTARNFQPWQGGIVFVARDDSRDWGTYMLSFEDDAPGPLPQLSLTSTEVDESDGVATVQVKLNRPASETVSGLVFTRPGADTVPGRDYLGFTREFEFSPGQVSIDIEIAISNDTIAEPDERFSINLAEIENASLGQPAIGQVTIKDDDEVDPSEHPQIQLEALSGAVNESVGQVTVAATLDRAATETVKVLLFSRSTGSATGGTDYYGFTEALEFAPGQLRQTVDIEILDDTVVEPRESFVIVLTQPEFARLGDAAQQEIIIDDNDSR